MARLKMFVLAESLGGVESLVCHPARMTHASLPLPALRHPPVGARGRPFNFVCANGSIVELKDPQGVFAGARIEDGRLAVTVVGGPGHHTAFVRLHGRATEFWQPVDLEIRDPIEMLRSPPTRAR